MPDRVSFLCKYCLETHTVEYSDDEEGFFETFDYPNVCPHCRTTRCGECGEIIKPRKGYCQHCGQVDPDFSSMLVRTSSTSAGYAEQNWTPAVKRWDDSSGKLEDENHRYETWTDIETGDSYMQEVTVEDGERVELSKRKLSKKEVSKIYE